MAEKHTTRTVEIRGLELHEDVKMPLFEASFDGPVTKSSAVCLGL